MQTTILFALVIIIAVVSGASYYPQSNQCPLTLCETGTRCVESPKGARCIPARCLLPVDGGTCLALFTRYYYDSTTNQCRVFTYGGCDGNANNFQTREECTQVCQGPY